MNGVTIIRGFRLNNCKKCGSPAKVMSESDVKKNHDSVKKGVYVGCSDVGCDSPDMVTPSFVRSGRAWNWVN